MKAIAKVYCTVEPPETPPALSGELRRRGPGRIAQDELGVDHDIVLARAVAAADTDTLEGGRIATRALLGTGYQPTAIICVNDIMAVGALRELRERGIRVPNDISVTGFDNVKLSEFCYPALTTVHIPRDRIGHLVFERLTAGSGAAEDRDIVIDPEFVLRDSTGPAAS